MRNAALVLVCLACGACGPRFASFNAGFDAERTLLGFLFDDEPSGDVFFNGVPLALSVTHGTLLPNDNGGVGGVVAQAMVFERDTHFDQHGFTIEERDGDASVVWKFPPAAPVLEGADALQAATVNRVTVRDPFVPRCGVVDVGEAQLDVTIEQNDVVFALPAMGQLEVADLDVCVTMFAPAETENVDESPGAATFGGHAFGRTTF
jgi:hypothetical protein